MVSVWVTSSPRDKHSKHILPLEIPAVLFCYAIKQDAKYVA